MSGDDRQSANLGLRSASSDGGSGAPHHQRRLREQRRQVVDDLVGTRFHISLQPRQDQFRRCARQRERSHPKAPNIERFKREEVGDECRNRSMDHVLAEGPQASLGAKRLHEGQPGDAWIVADTLDEAGDALARPLSCRSRSVSSDVGVEALHDVVDDGVDEAVQRFERELEAVSRRLLRRLSEAEGRRGDWTRRRRPRARCGSGRSRSRRPPLDLAS